MSSILQLLGNDMRGVQTLDLPLYVTLGKKKLKNFHLNLNNYRNAHHYTLNNSKKGFKNLIEESVKDLDPVENVILIYELYLPTLRKTDVNNVCSVVDKYFADVLVECEIIPDDNYNHLKTTIFHFGGIDRENPRAVVYIIDEEVRPLL